MTPQLALLQRRRTRCTVTLATGFHTYERDGVTAVFWQEGSTVCVLVGDGPSRAVLELAIEKAMIPA